MTIDKRKAPRFETRFPCTVTTGDQERVAAMVSNISQNGLQLTCNATVMPILYPNYKRTDYHAPIAVAIEFRVPTRDREKAPIHISCNLVYCRRCAQNQFKVGCQFSAMDKDSETALTEFIQFIGVPSYSNDQSSSF